MIDPNLNELRVIQGSANLTDDELIELYEYPSSAAQWIRANFVISIDGAVATGGTSSGLTTPLDQRVLKLLRTLSDVVLVGANTIRAEDYIGIRISESGRAVRQARGLAPVPPIAVVSGSAGIDPKSRLLTHTTVPPIILTTVAAPAAAKRALETAGAQVIELGIDTVETSALVDALASLGFHRIVCEGGPILTGQLAVDGALDELCVTTVPRVIGGTSRRITYSGQLASVPMQCQHIVVDTDGSQLARWIRSDS